MLKKTDVNMFLTITMPKNGLMLGINDGKDTVNLSFMKKTFELMSFGKTIPYF